MPNSRPLPRALLKGLLFVLPLLACSAWLEEGLRRMPTALGLKRAGFEAAAAGAQVLVLGGSEAYQGLSPALLARPGYNLATVGQDLYYDQALFAAVRGRLPQLKTVIVGLSYPSLEYRLPLSPEAWRQFQYSQVWGLTPEDAAARWDLRRFSALALMEPWPALKAAAVGFRGEAVAMGPDGWQALEPLGEDLQDLRINDLTTRKRVRYHDGLLDGGRASQGAGWLMALASAVDRSGAKPCLVILPVTKAYAGLVDQARLARLRAAAAAAAQSQHGLCLDYFGDARFGDGDFADPDHLNRLGAARLASLLRTKLP